MGLDPSPACCPADLERKALEFTREDDGLGDGSNLASLLPERSSNDERTYRLESGSWRVAVLGGTCTGPERGQPGVSGNAMWCPRRGGRRLWLQLRLLGVGELHRR